MANLSIRFLWPASIFAMVKTWLASGLRLPRSGVGRWYVTPLPSVCPCHYRVTCVLTLTGLVSSFEVLLSGRVDASHLLVKHQFRGMELTSGRYPHDITNSYLLKRPRSRLTSVVCLDAFGLATCLEALTKKWWRCDANT